MPFFFGCFCLYLLLLLLSLFFIRFLKGVMCCNPVELLICYNDDGRQMRDEVENTVVIKLPTGNSRSTEYSVHKQR